MGDCVYGGKIYLFLAEKKLFIDEDASMQLRFIIWTSWITLKILIILYYLLIISIIQIYFIYLNYFKLSFNYVWISFNNLKYCKLSSISFNYPKY